MPFWWGIFFEGWVVNLRVETLFVLLVLHTDTTELEVVVVVVVVVVGQACTPGGVATGV